jgi:hypothetical protein
MYAALWRILPGPVWVRVILLVLLAAAAIYVLVRWAFPWAAAFLLPQDSSVGGT